MSRARRDTSPAQRVYLPREGLDRVPLFHAQGEYRPVVGDGGIRTGDEVFTRCGLLVYQYRRDRGVLVDRTSIRLDHAESFAEACRRCWPDLPMPF